MKKGITLIEIIVVLMILSILAAFFLPMYDKIIMRTEFKEVASVVSLVRAGARYYELKYGIGNLPADETAWGFLQIDNNPSGSGTSLIYVIVSSGGDPTLQVSYDGIPIYEYNIISEVGAKTADPNAKYLPDNLP